MPDSSPKHHAPRLDHKQYQRLVEGLRDVLWVLDLETLRFTYVSPSVSLLLGYLPEELVGEPMENAFEPEKREHWIALTKERADCFQAGQMATDNRFVDDMALRCKQGTKVWVETVSHYLRNPETGRLESCGLTRDTTERRTVEEALRVSETRHRLLAEHANEVIWTMRLDGTVSHLSAAVQALRGFTREEALQQTMEQTLTPPSLANAMGYFTSLLQAIEEGRDPPDFLGEHEYYCKDGSTLWTEVRAFPVRGSNGRIVELLGITRDINVRKRHEDELRQAQAQAAAANEGLQRANQELSRLADVAKRQASTERVLREEQERLFAMLAHELKTPLATVRLLASDPNRRDGLEITRAVSDMNEVIERCVQSGQLSERRMQPRRNHFELAQLIRDTVQSSHWGSRVDFTCLAPGTSMHSDAQMVHMVINNLVDNAAKYSPANSRVSVELSATDDVFTIQVSNLPGDAGWPDSKRLFDKYYRAPHAHRKTGAGLGLFVVAGLVRLLGGRIDYRPTEQDIRFMCKLPAEPPAAVLA